MARGKKAETRAEELARKGVLFALRGGPYDGSVFRLRPEPAHAPAREVDGRVVYGDQVTESCWDELPILYADEGTIIGRYVRPDDVDPLMKWSGKVSKKKDNGPYLEWVPGVSEGEEAASAALLNDTGGNPMTTEASAA